MSTHGLAVLQVQSAAAAANFLPVSSALRTASPIAGNAVLNLPSQRFAAPASSLDRSLTVCLHGSGCSRVGLRLGRLR